MHQIHKAFLTMPQLSPGLIHLDQNLLQMTKIKFSNQDWLLNTTKGAITGITSLSYYSVSLNNIDSFLCVQNPIMYL